jgi:glyoxylase-like metal-dependent hydrolase (beta-lactamase superfamily II)
VPVVLRQADACPDDCTGLGAANGVGDHEVLFSSNGAVSSPSRFPGGVGNTQQDVARFSSLFTGVRTKIFDRLPDETWVYPGHGNDTTLGAERQHLEEWRERGW